MIRERAQGLYKNFASALGRCFAEEPDVLEPVLLCLAGVACVGVIYLFGILIYDFLFDPNAVNVASRLDSISINPDKWIPL
jgi:hypothetical protein